MHILYINLEGIDGCGKSTHLILMDKFESDNEKTIC